MADIHVLDSAEGCTESIINKDSDAGAGANAAPRADMVFISATPLSELVWSPHKGLSLKYAGSSLAEKKASLLWNTESFDVIISSPQCTNGGESINVGDIAAGNLKKMQIELNSDNRNSDRVALPSSPKNTVDMQPAFPPRLCKHDSSSCGDMKFLNKLEEAILDDNYAHDLSDKKETGICSPKNSKCFGTIDPETDAAGTTYDKIFIAGPPNNDLSADSISCSLKALMPDQAQIEIECASNVGTLNDHHKEMIRTKKHEASGLVEVSAHEDSMSAKNGSNMKQASSSRFAECGDADVELDDAIDNTNRLTESHTSFHLLDRPNSGDVPSIDIGILSKVGTAAVLQSQDGGNGETWQANTKNEPALIGSQSACNANPRNLEKGKEKVIHVGDSGSVSKERVDSNESVESSSRRLASTQKRARSYNSKPSLGIKRAKKESNGSSCSGSFLRKDSSFMNWISTITNGFSGHGQITHSSANVPKSSNSRKENLGPFPMPDDKSSSIACRTIGFNSVFQALYCRNVTAHGGTSDHNNEREADALQKPEVMSKELDHGSHHVVGDGLEFNINMAATVTSQEIHRGSKELHVTSEPFAMCSPQAVCHREGGKLDTLVSFSDERLDQGMYRVEFPSTTVHVSSTSSTINEKMKQACIVNNIRSPSSSTKSGSGSPEDKGTGALVSIPNSSSNQAFNSRSGFCQNSWITRLLPKASSPILNPVPCNGGAVATQNLNNKSSMLSSPTRGKVAPGEGHENPDDCSLSYLETKRGARNGGMKPYLTCPTVSYGLKEPEDQKFTSKLSPIQPSQRFKNSEQIASLFAKRLGAFRHIMPLKNSDGTSGAATTCFFCGNTGHSLRECSELVETDLEDLLKYMNSQDGTDRPLSLCIRCFQLNHWAIACPHASSKKKNSSDNSFIVNNDNSGKLDEDPGRHSSANYDGRYVLWSGDKREHEQQVSMHEIPQIRESRVQTKLVVHRSGSIDEVAGPSSSGLYSNPVNKDLAESRIKLKARAFNSEDNELKEKCIIPFCNFVATEVGNEPAEMFETIRRLRLSRADVIRWLKSPNAHFSLEGFFLRLRLGKWEEGLGGTGYHVARINGARLENCLSVSIGVSTCFVEYRTVSNHDFLEDELKAWWSAITKGDGKLPSREELNEKLNERVKLGI